MSCFHDAHLPHCPPAMMSCQREGGKEGREREGGKEGCEIQQMGLTGDLHDALSQSQ